MKNNAEAQGRLIYANGGVSGSPATLLDSYAGASLEVRSSANVTVSDAVTVTVLRLTGGSTTFSGPVTVLSNYEISGGAIATVNNAFSMPSDLLTVGTGGTVRLNVSLGYNNVVVVGGTLEVNAAQGWGAVMLTNGAVLTHAAATASSAPRLELTVSDTLSVSTNSRIDVKDKGYLTGRTYPNTTTGASTGRSGGSYGGLGGKYSTGNVNPVYGDYMNPNEPGSGSGADNGGPGGGLARITAGVLDLRGQLTASASDSCYGRGSGGGIYLNVGRLTGGGKFWRWVEGALVRMPAAVGGG